MIEYLLLTLKKSRIYRGKAFLIRGLSKMFISLKSYSFKKIGYSSDLFLDLSDNASIFLFLNDGFIPHENGLVSVFKHFESSNK